MPRPKKAIVDFFPHFVNNGKSIFVIESKFGNEGYAFWFKLLELLGASEHHFLDCNNIATWEFLLAKTKFKEEEANEMMDLLSKIGCINDDLWKENIIRSDKFIENLDALYQRRKINVITNEEVMGLCIRKLPLNGINVDIYPQSKVKDSEVKDSKEELFNECWKLFGSYGTKKKAWEYWKKLSNKDRSEIKDRIPVYLQSLSQTGFHQKMFQGWINPKERMWDTTYENTPQTVEINSDELTEEQIAPWLKKEV